MVKVNSKSQNGRSMVEMLGVLAIIGVLSVGGVYGYGVAMKKHKANELLHQASMLATTISAQAMTNDGNLPQTITSFGNTNYGTFSTRATEALNGKGFSIEISNLDGSICNQLKEGGMIRNVTCDPNAKKATITYYKNLATDPAEGEKSPTGGKEKVDPCESVTCESGQECIGGACAKVTGDCSNNSDCDKWCKDNGGDEKCYCAINANMSRDRSACWENFTGQCAVASTQSGIKGGYVVSSEDMTWWSAVNFCKAHNKSLVSLADLGITGGYQDDARCSGSECMGTVNWQDLRSKIAYTEDSEDYYWMTDAASCESLWACTAGTNNNSCEAFHMHLSSAVIVSYRNNGGADDNFALCE